MKTFIFCNVLITCYIMYYNFRSCIMLFVVGRRYIHQNNRYMCFRVTRNALVDIREYVNSVL